MKFDRVTNDVQGQGLAYRQGVLSGVDEVLRHLKAGATPEQLQAWRGEVERWTDARGWPSPPPDLGDVEGGAE